MAQIVNYGERFRAGERISTGFVESAINQIVDKRFDKRQSMRWTPRGAHLLLQTRTRVLNGDLDSSSVAATPASGNQPSTMLPRIVIGSQLCSSRAIERVERLSAANSTIRAKYLPLFWRRRAKSPFEHRALLRPQPDLHRIGYDPDVQSRIRLL